MILKMVGNAVGWRFGKGGLVFWGEGEVRLRMDVAVEFSFGKRGNHGRISLRFYGEGSRVACKVDWILEDRAQDRWLDYLSTCAQPALGGCYGTSKE